MLYVNFESSLGKKRRALSFKKVEHSRVTRKFYLPRSLSSTCDFFFILKPNHDIKSVI